ncbi:calcineurin subunit B [Drosophila biarmipes]|uniref:calcineurin subunit B n=1 Tax=Drosophila biarmipes TaxID=125945 RepID=UPI0007E726D3|nr:calcineurin subunit B [Drosophila biarmipes]XP_050745095.1 calcineurin subunit B [Drosophila biarmipes]XP_050745096.1 calcineurin subunit B [Drosophila biarmipes]
MKLDLTMNDRFNQRFQSVYSGLVPQIARLGPFNDSEVTCILLIYYKFSLQNGPAARRITSTQFVNIVIGFQQLYDMDVVDRIVTLIAGGRKYVTPMEFVNYMTILMTRDMERKMKFAYMVYDKNGMGINREIISSAVERFFPGDDDEVIEMRLDMVDFLLLKFDEDQDAIISFEEYRTIVVQQPSMLEFLGPIFPTDETRLVVAYCTAIYSHIPEMGMI